MRQLPGTINHLVRVTELAHINKLSLARAVTDKLVSKHPIKNQINLGYLAVIAVCAVRRVIVYLSEHVRLNHCRSRARIELR